MMNEKTESGVRGEGYKNEITTLVYLIQSVTN
jgi:hypothetical protein